MTNIQDILTEKKSRILKENGYSSMEDIDKATRSELTNIEGIGDKTVNKLRGVETQVVEKETQSYSPTTEAMTEKDVQGMIEDAIKNGAEVSELKNLFDFLQDVKKRQASAALTQAKANVQRKMPSVEKTNKVLEKDKKTVRYKYADLEDITSAIKGVMAEEGLSYSWDTENVEKNGDTYIKITAKITHRMGATETSTIELPVLEGKYMNRAQTYASTLTYGKRYTLSNLLGISTGEDDDANSAGAENRRAGGKKANIVMNLRMIGYDTKKMGKEKIREVVEDKTDLNLEEENYDEIITRLEALVAEKQHADNSNENNENA